MKMFLQKHHRLLFYGCWIILGLIQSGLTELQDDEAYYWVYGRYLDWGYFDHPPMIGLLVKMGYAIFPNELGVRLFPFLLHVMSLFIIEKLLNKKSPFLFYIIAISIAVLQVSGFVAVPDIPLIFFTALFFLCYKKFVDQPSLLNVFLLGLSMSLLLYSKYHAVLIVFFALFSNIKLFSRYQVWLAGVIALVLFTPHLWWQYQHDWVSFRYHLFESNVNPYKPSYTLDYIIGQLLLPGPIAGFILLPAAFFYKPTDKTEKALKYTMAGIYLFFLLSSFRGRVEANWTSPVMVPLMVLSHQFLLGKERWQLILYKLMPLTLVLVLFARIIMITDLLPVRELKIRYHSWKDWPEKMKENTGGMPAVFSTSYQRASKYWFYSGQPTYSLNNYRGRKNNFNLWPLEDSLLGKPLYYLDIYDLHRFNDSFQAPTLLIGYRYDTAFVSYARIDVDIEPARFAIKEGETISMKCLFNIPEHYARYIRSHPSQEDTIRIGFFNKKGWVKDAFPALDLQQVIAQNHQQLDITPGLPKGKYYFRFAINRGYRNPTHNSDKTELVVE